MPIDPKLIAKWKALPSPEAVPALLADRVELVALLRELEWCGLSTDGMECPTCSQTLIEGHRADCRLAAFLR